MGLIYWLSKLATMNSMTDQDLQKRETSAQALLERARRAVPAPAEGRAAECQALLDRYRTLLKENELASALGVLEAVGDMVPCRGGFWRDLERSAETWNCQRDYRRSESALAMHLGSS
jgi:hypothetical protein